MGKKNNNAQIHIGGGSATSILKRLEKESYDDDWQPSVVSAPWKLEKSLKTKHSKTLDNTQENAHHKIISARTSLGAGRAQKMPAAGAPGLLHIHNSFKKERDDKIHPSVVSAPWKLANSHKTNRTKTFKYTPENSQQGIATDPIDSERTIEKVVASDATGVENRHEKERVHAPWETEKKCRRKHMETPESTQDNIRQKSAGAQSLSAGQTLQQTPKPGSTYNIPNVKAPALNNAKATTGGTMKNCRTSKELPLHGQPGGLDDPLRKGLSGAGIRWYLRYLSSGLSAEKARAKAESHRKQFVKPGQEPYKNANTISRCKDVTCDPNSKIRTFSSEANARKLNITYAHVLSSVRVAVFPVEYPRETLTKDELISLEESIASEIPNGWNCKLQFNGIHFLTDMLIVDCKSMYVAKWLEHIVYKLKTWKGVKLKACREDELPRTYTIRILLPQKACADSSVVLAFMAAQNEGLNIETWKVLNFEVSNGIQALTAVIEEKSAQAVMKNNCKIYYRFGELEVAELKKNEINGQQNEIIKQILQNSLSNNPSSSPS